MVNLVRPFGFRRWRGAREKKGSKGRSGSAIAETRRVDARRSTSVIGSRRAAECDQAVISGWVLSHSFTPPIVLTLTRSSVKSPVLHSKHTDTRFRSDDPSLINHPWPKERHPPRPWPDSLAPTLQSSPTAHSTSVTPFGELEMEASTFCLLGCAVLRERLTR